MKNKVLSADELNERAKKRLMLIGIIGLLMLSADLFMSANEGVNIVESKGQLYMMRPDEGKERAHTSLKATIKGGKKEIEKKVDISLEAYCREKKGEKKDEDKEGVMSETEMLEYELKSLANGFNKDRSSRKVLLPQKLQSGESIYWEAEQTNNGPAIIMCALILAATVYKTRLSPLDKIRKQEQESVIMQLPEFANKLVLLLNAGLVMNSAFEKAIEESLRFESNDNDYFHRKLKEGYKTVKTTNGSLNREFRSFARQSGTKELMRISNIINDNVNKGVELTEKLQRESEALWLNRKKNCEEKGRLAETKLTLPLVIFLMVLIMITVAPAMLEL
ncbi:MAG: hypothetical protein GX663_02885 [Clostridiales bacterium]|nr:hypothetical protein [Clostridiales bacterium]